MLRFSNYYTGKWQWIHVDTVWWIAWVEREGEEVGGCFIVTVSFFFSILASLFLSLSVSRKRNGASEWSDSLHCKMWVYGMVVPNRNILFHVVGLLQNQLHALWTMVTLRPTSPTHIWETQQCREKEKGEKREMIEGGKKKRARHGIIWNVLWILTFVCCMVWCCCCFLICIVGVQNRGRITFWGWKSRDK